MRHFLPVHVNELAARLRVLSADNRSSSSSSSSSSWAAGSRSAEAPFLQVAVQFSDDTAADIMEVYEQLHGALRNDSIHLYIISDSSFVATCYDDIAASHVESDVLVFFGSVELSGSDSDVGKAAGMTENVFTATSTSGSASGCGGCQGAAKGPLVIKVPKWKAIDVESSLSDILSCIRANDLLRGRRVVMLNEQTFSSGCVLLLRDALAGAIGEEEVLLAHSLGAAREALSREEGSSFLLYVGDDKTSAFFALCAIADVPVLVYRPSDGPGARAEALVHAEFSGTRQFRERYGGVAKVKDAQVIGIIVGSMGLSSQTTRDVVSRLKLLISAAKKSYYYFVIGKLNEAKLCNFPDVDVFCLVTNYNEVVRPKTYHVPVVTAFELEVGLGARLWSGEGSRLDPEFVLDDDLASAVSRVETVFSDAADSDSQCRIGADADVTTHTSALIATESCEVVSKYSKEVSIGRYQSRSYKGLVDSTEDPSNNNVVSTDIVRGRDGVAAAYSNR